MIQTSAEERLDYILHVYEYVREAIRDRRGLGWRYLTDLEADLEGWIEEEQELTQSEDTRLERWASRIRKERAPEPADEQCLDMQIEDYILEKHEGRR